MKEQRLTIWAVVILFLLGASAALARLILHQNGSAADDRLWRLTYNISFTADKPGTRIHVALPHSTRDCRVYREDFSESGLSTGVVRNRRTGSRSIVAVPVKWPERVTLAAGFDIQVSPGKGPSDRALEKALSTEERAHYLQAERGVQVSSPEVSEVLMGLSRGSTRPEGLLERIFQYCWEDIEPGDYTGPADAAGALSHGAPSVLGRARAMVALCRTGGIPARLVLGFIVRSQTNARPHVWLEAFNGRKWIPYDPELGYSRDLPANYLPVRRDGIVVVTSSAPLDLVSKFSIQRAPPAPGSTTFTKRTFFDFVDLTRLPAGMQETLAIVLLLPAGALVTALFRNLIGIETFGTFAPALLALSCVYADWRMGLIVFVLVLVIGLSARALLHRMKLLMVPRLSIMLTVIVLCMAMAVLILDYLGLTPSARAVILPLVIMTMMIERFYVTSEEDGLRYALKLLAGTIVVAACCLLLLRWEELGRLALRFPESTLVIAAGLLLIGRYSGYRLTELLRFRDLGGRGTPGD